MFEKFKPNTDKDLSAHQPPENIETKPEDLPGELLNIRPYAENTGISGGAELLRAVHDPEKGLFGRNNSDAHSFEIWHDNGKLKFFMHAANEEAADDFKRRVATNYSDSVTTTVEDRAFPEINEDDYVVGSYCTMKKGVYFPIRHFEDGDGFETDPYADLTADMLSDEDTRIVMQVVFKAAREDWTQGGFFNSNSVHDVAEGLRNGRCDGWINPTIKDPTSKELASADIVESQVGEPAFHTNIRILAISPDKQKAKQRVRSLSRKFHKFYESTTQQSLEGNNISTKNWDGLSPHVERMRNRTWTDRSMIMSIHELAGVAHIPNRNEVQTPNIEWVFGQSGGRVPPEMDWDVEVDEDDLYDLEDPDIDVEERKRQERLREENEEFQQAKNTDKDEDDGDDDEDGEGGAPTVK